MLVGREKTRPRWLNFCKNASRASLVFFMVRIYKSRWHEAYEKIKQDSLEGNCIVFVASDVDALCACKILQVGSSFSMHSLVARNAMAETNRTRTKDAFEIRFHPSQDRASVELLRPERS